MSDDIKTHWDCPVCFTEFNKYTIPALINKIGSWLSNRPSTTMDCSIEKVAKYYSILSELKDIQIQYVRKPTNMMASQTIAAEIDKEKSHD